MDFAPHVATAVRKLSIDECSSKDGGNSLVLNRPLAMLLDDQVCTPMKLPPICYSCFHRDSQARGRKNSVLYLPRCCIVWIIASDFEFGFLRG